MGDFTVFEIRSAELCDTARYRGGLHLADIVTWMCEDVFPVGCKPVRTSIE